MYISSPRISLPVISWYEYLYLHPCLRVLSPSIMPSQDLLCMQSYVRSILLMAVVPLPPHSFSPAVSAGGWALSLMKYQMTSENTKNLFWRAGITWFLCTIVEKNCIAVSLKTLPHPKITTLSYTYAIIIAQVRKCAMYPGIKTQLLMY